jgi:hypothetical protein
LESGFADSPRGSISSDSWSAPSEEEKKAVVVAKKKKQKRPKTNKINYMKIEESINLQHQHIGTEILRFLSKQSQIIHVWSNHIVISNEGRKQLSVISTKNNKIELL